MKNNSLLFPLQAPQPSPLPVQRPNLPRVLLMSANPVTTTTDLNQAIPKTLATQNVDIVVVLPAFLEITGYPHGGIND